MYRLLSAIILSVCLMSAETDWRFAFPQSELLMGVDLKWLLKSPLGVKVKSELEPSLKGIEEYKSVEAILDQVEGVYFSAVTKAPVKNSKGALVQPKGQSTSDLVILLKGKFDFAQLTALAAKQGMVPETWGKTKVLVPALPRLKQKAVKIEKAQFSSLSPGGLPMDVSQAKPIFALYDEKNILVAEEGPLRVALERMESGLTPQANPLFERARDLEAANDFWIVGSTAPLNLNPAAPGNKSAPADPISQMMSQVRNFSIALAVRRNVALDLQLQTVSPKVAAQMLDMAKGVMALAKASQKPEEPLPFDVDKALQLSASGNLVRASITLEQSEIDKLMAQAMKRGPGVGLSNSSPASANETFAESKPVVVAPPKPAVPQRKTVLIYGMPGGPKEVPVQ